MAHQLRDAGAEIHLFQPANWDWERWLTTYYRLSTLSLRYAQRPAPSLLWTLAQQFRCEWWQSDSEFHSLTVGRASLPVLLSGGLKDYFEALTERDHLTAWLDEQMAGYDALLLPVAMTTAFIHCPTGSAIQVDDKAVPYWLANGAYLQPFNLAGNPAIVMPIGNNDKGLPIGLQVVGHRWREMELLSAAAAIDAEVGQMLAPQSSDKEAGSSLSAQG